jgi:hypothetical protein
MSSQYHLITKKQEQGGKQPGTEGFCPASEESLPHRSHFDPGGPLKDIGSVCNTIIDHCYYLGTELGVRDLDPRRPTILEEIYLLHDKISSLTRLGSELEDLSSLTRLGSDLEDLTKKVTEIVQRQTSLEAILIAESQKNQQISSKKRKRKKNRQILKQILTNQEKHSGKLKFIESMNAFLFYFILFYLFIFYFL